MYDGSPPFQCDRCPANIRPGRNCEEAKGKPLSLDLETVDGKNEWKYQYDFCPVNYVQTDHRTWLGLYSLFRQGHLLVEGGINDQPSKYMDVMMFLDGLWNQNEAERLEEMKKK